MKSSYLIFGAVVIAAIWILNKITLYENVSIEPVSLKIEPGFLNTQSNLTMIVKNPTGKTANVKMITGKIFAGENEIGVFYNKPGFSIQPMKNILVNFFAEFKTPAILENLSKKDLKIRGVAYVDNILIPFEKIITV